MQLKNWLISAVAVLGLSVNNGCGAPAEDDELGQTEQDITLEQAGHLGFRTPTSVGNLLCVPNLAGQACFYPASKLIKFGQDSATMSGFSVQVGSAMDNAINLNGPQDVGGTGFVLFRTNVIADMALKFVGVSTFPASATGADKYITVGCDSGSATQLTESIPGDYFKCSKATAKLNVVKLKADFPDSGQFGRALEDVIGHGVLAFAGLASSTRTSTFETWQSSVILHLVPPHHLTAWQRCELSNYAPGGTGYNGSGTTCLDF